MKKVALIKKDFSSQEKSQGGFEKVTGKIIEALKRRGATVSFLTAGWKTPEANGPDEVIRCPFQSCLKFNQIREFDRWCHKITHPDYGTPYDVVFSMDRTSFQTHHRAGNGVHAAYLAIRRQKEPLKALSFMFNPLHRTLLELEKKSFEDPFLQKLIVNSVMVKNQILEYYSTPPHKIHVVHNGTEWNETKNDFIASLTNKKSIALSLGLDPDLFHFLFVGSNFERKGLTPLLQAFYELRRSDFHLSVIGRDKNLKKFKKKVTKLGLERQVTFFGYQQNVQPFYQLSDVLLIPSLYDPSSNVTIEALAMGLFVISSKGNGGHEVLNDYSGITLNNAYDLSEMKAALKKGFDHPKKIFQAEKIRNSVEHLDLANQMEKICHLCLL